MKDEKALPRERGGKKRSVAPVHRLPRPMASSRRRRVPRRIIMGITERRTVRRGPLFFVVARPHGDKIPATTVTRSRQ